MCVVCCVLYVMLCARACVLCFFVLCVGMLLYVVCVCVCVCVFFFFDVRCVLCVGDVMLCMLCCVCVYVVVCVFLWCAV